MRQSATIKLRPTDRLTVTLSADYFQGGDTSVVVHYLGDSIQRRSADLLVTKAVNPTAAAAAAAQITTVRPLGVPAYENVTNPVGANGLVVNPEVLYQDSIPTSRRTYYGGSAILNYEILDTVQAKSITAYRQGSNRNFFDLDPLISVGSTSRDAVQ